MPQSEPIRRMLTSLDGLSVGDAFGQCFMSAYESLDAGRFERRDLPKTPWMYTDDTEMAIGIVEELTEGGCIVQNNLARRFAARYMAEPHRGYGSMAKSILTCIYAGDAWRDVSCGAFDGQGSMGNGSAMRVAPLGAFFADDLAQLIEQARLSAEVTHFHPEGCAGAIAIALAAAFACAHPGQTPQQVRQPFFDFVLEHTPESRTKDGIDTAMRLKDADIARAARVLGNGGRITCADTVPFCLWCTARHHDNYVDALWTAVEGLGDIDTNCAIVGGIVALSNPRGVPDEWLNARGELNMKR